MIQTNSKTAFQIENYINEQLSNLMDTCPKKWDLSTQKWDKN